MVWSSSSLWVCILQIPSVTPDTWSTCWSLTPLHMWPLTLPQAYQTSAVWLLFRWLESPPPIALLPLSHAMFPVQMFVIHIHKAANGNHYSSSVSLPWQAPSEAHCQNASWTLHSSGGCDWSELSSQESSDDTEEQTNIWGAQTQRHYTFAQCHE